MSESEDEWVGVRESTRGRPAILSSEAIVETALEQMLKQQPMMDISMAQIARTLSVSATALYRYFPTRNLLLNALAERVFANFPPLDDTLDWPDQLRAWQDSLFNLFERYPSLTRLMGWDEEIAPTWFMVQMPVMSLMHRAGLRKQKLVDTMTWFFAGSVGLLRTQMIADAELRRPSHLVSFESSLTLLSDTERAIVEENLPYIPKGNSREIARIGLDALVEGVVAQVALLARDAPPSAPSKS